MKRSWMGLAMCVLAACGQEERPNESEDGGPRETVETRISITPERAYLIPGETIVVRLDVSGAQNEAVSGYSIDLDEAQSRIDIRTAPCPAGEGGASCQDWTITPANDATLGTYRIGVRTVGLRASQGQNRFFVTVVDRNPRYGGASAVASSQSGKGPSVALAEGRLYAAGTNAGGALGGGYYRQPFSYVGDTEPFLPHEILPGYSENFVPIAANGLTFRAIAANDDAVFAVSADGRPFHWGKRVQGNAGAAPVSPQFPAQFVPTPIEGVDIPLRAIGADQFIIVGVTQDDRAIGWGRSDPDMPDPRPRIIAPTVLDHEADNPPELLGVRAVGGTGTRGDFNLVMNNGDMREVGNAYAGLWSGARLLPINIVQFVDGPESVLARTQSGQLWHVRTSSRRVGTLADVTDMALLNDDRAIILRAPSPDISVLDLATGEILQTIAPPAGSAFIALTTRHVITNDCTATSGSLWRLIHSSDNNFAPLRMELVPGFGEGGSCPEVDLRTVRVSFDIEGAGMVSSNRGPMTCTATRCEALYRPGQNVDFAAIPQPGWSVQSQVCNVNLFLIRVLTEPVQCSLRFARTAPLEHTLSMTVSGHGDVTSSPEGISCGSRCESYFHSDAVVTLVPEPSRGYLFTGFGGDADCRDGGVTMATAVNCVARFELMTVPPAVSSFRVLELTGSSVTLAWEPSDASISSYRISRALGDGPFVEVRRIIAGNHTAVDSGLTALTRYRYQIIAVNDAGVSVPVVTEATTAQGTEPTFPTGWTQLGASLPGTMQRNPRIVFDRDGNPVVAVIENDTAGVPRVRVRKLETEWVDLGVLRSVPQFQLPAAEVELAIDDGQIVAAWTEYINESYLLFVSRWDGSQWRPLCNGLTFLCSLNEGAANRFASRISLTADRDGIVATWIEAGEINVRAYVDGAWRRFRSTVESPAGNPITPVRAGEARFVGNFVFHSYMTWLPAEGAPFIGALFGSSEFWQGDDPFTPEPAPTGIRGLTMVMPDVDGPLVAWIEEHGAGEESVHIARQNIILPRLEPFGGAAAQSVAGFRGITLGLNTDELIYVAAAHDRDGPARMDIVTWNDSGNGHWDDFASWQTHVDSPQLAFKPSRDDTSLYFAWLRENRLEVWRYTP